MTSDGWDLLSDACWTQNTMLQKYCYLVASLNHNALYDYL